MRLSNAGVLSVGLASGTTGQINLIGTTSGVVSLKVADTAGTWSMTLPDAVPASSGYVLSATTGGVCSWAAAGNMILGSTQTNTGAKTFNDATLILAGSSSGTTTLKANATAGTTTQTFQAVTGTVYCSGGTDVAYTDGGTGLSTYPTRTIILLAGGAALGTTNQATRETRQMATNKQVVDVLKFKYGTLNPDDTSVAWFCFPIPDSFDSGTFAITIQYFNVTAESNKFVVFQAAMSASADGEAIDVAVGTTQVIKAACSSTDNFQKWATFPAITASPTPAPAHQMFIKLWRDPTTTDDDSGQDVYVQSLKVEFVANSYSD
jgi:hypothetical protein